jgi:hypothetical protein
MIGNNVLGKLALGQISTSGSGGVVVNAITAIGVGIFIPPSFGPTVNVDAVTAVATGDFVAPDIILPVSAITANAIGVMVIPSVTVIGAKRVTKDGLIVEDVDTSNYLRVTKDGLIVEDVDDTNWLRVTKVGLMVEYKMKSGRVFGPILQEC